MTDQNWRNLMDERKLKASRFVYPYLSGFLNGVFFSLAQIQAMIKYAQLQQHNETDMQRYQHTAATLLEAEKANQKLIQVAKAVL